MHSSIDSQHIRGVEKAEQVRAVSPRALKGKVAIDLILGINCLIETRLQRVLMRVANNWDLVVVARIPSNVRQRIEIQQRLGLWAEWNGVAGEQQSRSRIEDLDGLALRVQLVREIPGPLRQIWHQSGLRSGITASRPLVAHKKVRTFSPNVRNSQRAAERRHT